MTLDEYLTKTGMTDSAFAVTVGISQSQVNRLRRGDSMPSWQTAERIKAATKSKVTANDFSAAKASAA